MAIIEDKGTNIITTKNPDVVLDPESMIDGAPLKVTPSDFFSKLDALIEDVEKDTAKFKESNVATLSADSDDDVMYCDLHFRNKAGKKIKLYGPLAELEVSLPYRVTMHLSIPQKVVGCFMKFCISSSFNSNKNKVFLELCQTSVSKKRLNKMILFSRHEKGYHKTYLQLDFFKTKRLPSGKSILELEFVGC